MLPIAQNLIDEAKAGKRLNAPERRRCVGYLMATCPDYTNQEMATLFGVTERMIRVDKRTIREEKAKLIKEDDISLVIADLLLDYERIVNDVEKSKKAAKLGSKTFLDHCRYGMEMRLKTVEALQALGYLPKNLGNMTIEKFDFKATVSKDGSIETRRLDATDIIVESMPTEDENERNAFSEEYGTKALAAKPEDK